MIQSQCPSCGAPLTFESKASLIAVCSYCRSTVLRTGIDLERLGTVSEVKETHTPLQLGATGEVKGTGFKIIGRVQVRWEGGLWNEWYVTLGDGRAGWLAEANGQLTFLFPEEAPRDLPTWDGATLGDRISLGSQTYQIVERRRARVVGAEGELPFAVGDGYALPYLDCRSEGNRFATVDYAEADSPQVYTGPMVRLRELNMRGLRVLKGWDPKGLDVAGEIVDLPSESFECPSCGAPVTVSVPGQTQRIACTGCGSLLTSEDDRVKLIERFNAAMGQTPLRVGQRGILGGVKYQILGIVRRFVRDSGEIYSWHEYLLFNPYEGYRWLVENQGHWNFVEPCMGAPITEGANRMRLRDTVFQFYQGDPVEVEHVVGEFYWQVERGQRVQAADYIAPPYMLSVEGDAAEEVWSIATYTEPERIQDAFGAESLPRPSGVAPNQPFDPSGRAKKIYRDFAVLAAVLVVATLLQMFAAANTRVVSLTGELTPTDATPLRFSEPFTLTGRPSALEIKVDASVANQWVYLDMALFNEASGEIVLFDKAVEYYSGSGWSEGSHSGSKVIGPVPPGTWVLKVTPQSNVVETQTPIQYTLTLFKDVPRMMPGLIGLVLLGMVPLFIKLYERAFENRRWNP